MQGVSSCCYSVLHQLSLFVPYAVHAAAAHLNIRGLQIKSSMALHELGQHLLVQIEIIQPVLDKIGEKIQNMFGMGMQAMIVAWRMSKEFQKLWIFLVQSIC